MSCKHEELHVLGAEGYFCASPRCNKLYEGEVVILTKAQHDKMNAVVEGLKWADPLHIAHEFGDAIADALTALEGE